MSATVSGILIVVMIFIIIGYLIALYEMYKNKSYIFESYVTVPPADGCQPLIAIVKLTPEEIAARAKLLQSVPARK